MIASVPSILLAAALFLFVSSAPAADAVPQTLNAALLTRELGDPRAPGNVKLALSLPEDRSRDYASVRAEDFRVYVYPAELSREKGVDERYLAGGMYLWRNAGRIFLDARVVPLQDKEGPATVRVIYAPGGVLVAEGVAEGSSRYAAELVDVVLAVDVSLSMNYNDPRKRRVHAARSFIEMARQGGGIGRVGLVTFNHNAKRNVALLPLEQGETILNALRRVGAEGLTNLDLALETSLKELDGSRRPVVILLTDGKNEGTDYADTHKRAAERGVRIFTIGLSEQADHKLLMEMAETTGGIYFRAVKDSDLPEIYARLAAELGKRQLFQARLLDEIEGEVTLPIDASVRRLVAMADGGARVGVNGPGKGMPGAGSMAAVHVGRPDPGQWDFSWDRAAPGISVLALFGDTPFFLDMFPPQLHGNRLSVGATLAKGEAALGDAEVWMETVPGVITAPVRLYDDGAHDDGDAGDGVYGASIDLEQPPEQFDLTVRASGAAWEDGEFVRQAAGLAIRMPEIPPAARADLGGDIDFGVLFPGETGSAMAVVDLDDKAPRDMYMDLSWDAGDEPWPELSSRITVAPGRRVFELEMTVPDTARPGDYLGRFSISDDGDLGDRSSARVRVGTVFFDPASEIDLGTVPPGTFVARTARLGYTADKSAPLWVAVEGGDELKVAVAPEQLDAGRGEIVLDVTVSAPMGKEEGEYSGRVVLAAGPGGVEIPLRWRVKPFTTAAPAIEPIPGLPRPPELPSGTRPLERTSGLGSGFDPELWRPSAPAHAPESGGSASPWEKAEKVLRDRPSLPGSDLGIGVGPGRGDDGGGREPGFQFPAITKPGESDDGDSFWSAWWIYLLAALLLLLLLLLLIAYILYRLGKSHLARLLLASALANFVLLIIFIWLLGAIAVQAESTPTISVNLVSEEPTDAIQLTDSEKGMLDAAGLSGSSSGGGDAASPGEISFADAASAAAGGTMQLTKTNEIRDGQPDGMELADARQPSAQPLENRTREPLQRRERRPERSSLPQPMAAPDLPEMAEPPRDNEAQALERPEVGEARLDIEAAEASTRPVWSDGDRPVQPPANEQGMLLAQAPGMEAVSMDRTVRLVNPRGRRRSLEETPSAYPEPRVEIDDPIRDAQESLSPDSPENAVGDPGVEEVRVEPRAISADSAGRKPGSLIPPGVSRLSDSRLDDMPRGVSGTDMASSAAPRGGLRSTRGGQTREGSSLASPQGGMPGGTGAGGVNPSPPASGTSGRGQTGEVGEQRFDAEPGGGGLGTDGQPNASGSSRNPAAMGGGGSSPNPFQSGGGGGDRADFSPGTGTSGRGNGDSRFRGPGNRAGGGDRTGIGGGEPGGRDQIPGGRGGTGAGPGSDGGRSGDGGRGDGNGRGRGSGTGTGEGRFDDMARGSGGGEGQGRSASQLPGLGSSRLSGGEGAGSLDVLPLDVSDSDWKRNERRMRRRSVNVAASSVDMDSLVIVVGDFLRFPDPASEKLFGVLAERLGRGLAVDERVLSPGDVNLADTLLALLSPEEAAKWTDAEIGAAAKYLKAGGHIWMDAARRGQADPFLERLARMTGGSYGPLDAGHQLSDGESVDALVLRDKDKPGVVVTYQDWRKGWRGNDAKNGRTLRFLIRSLNLFLSGNADTGIVLDPEELEGGLRIEPSEEIIPEMLSGRVAGRGALWDDFGSGSLSSWRMPSWSDAGSLSVIADGQGGNALKMDLGAVVKGRAAVYRTLNPPQDFSSVERITLDAYYDGQGEATLSMVFTVQGAEGWLDYETPATTLTPGWNRLQFEIDRNNFRSLTSGGVVNSMPGAERTGRAGFFLYRQGDSPAVALFRDIRLHKE